MKYEVLIGDCLESLRGMESETIDCCVTSPPYFNLRDYGIEGQIGLESTIEEYVNKIVMVMREVRRVLKPEGTLWFNVGDSYNGSGGAGGDYNKGGLREGQPRYGRKNEPSLKPKDLMMIPARLALALQADGWYLRCDMIWDKPNAMPESAKDRTSRKHEYVFLLSKSRKYYYGENKLRSVWEVKTKPYKGAHFAVFPPELIEPCILAGCPPNGVVLDPFGGSGTTAGVAIKHGRNAIICELNEEYAKLIDERVNSIVGYNDKQATMTEWV